MNVGKGQTVPPGVTIEGLWERVETLIRERDEARSELAASREAWAVELDGAQTRRDELQRAYEAEAAQLRAALESKVRLTRERDEARAQVTALIDRLAEALSGDGVRIHFRSLDEAVAEARRLTAVCASHWAEANTLRALLREVEWHGWCPTLLSSPPAHASEASIATGACPFCQRFKFNGHAPDCRLKAALEGRDA